MASHHLTIAKASFVAACLRPDVTKVSRDEANVFHTLLDAAIHKCSPSNVQKCRVWLVDNVLPSPHRTGALGKYLASLVKYLPAHDASTTQTRLPLRRQRLHVLYLIHDVLHHAKYHTKNPDLIVNLVAGLSPTLLETFRLAASDNKPRIKRRLEELLKIWDRHGYVDADVTRDIVKLVIRGEVVVLAEKPADSDGPIRELPFVMPATHGDPSNPFYDLPAANLMPYMMPNMSIPMRPDQITALRLKPGLADQSLASAVKELLKEAKRLERPFSSLEDEGIIANMDEMGQLSYTDDDEQMVRETYYGWSREFCEKMRKRGQSGHDQARNSRSPGSDRDESVAAHKRRRRGSDRSVSGSLTPPSMGTPPHFHQSDTRKHAVDRRANVSGFVPHENEHSKFPVTGAGGRPYQHKVPPPPAGTSMMPIPPPRPPNWTGPWPPPPPPFPLISGNGFSTMPFPPAPPF